MSIQRSGVTSGWRYRLASVIGTATITALVVPVTSHPTVESLATSLPVISHLPRPVHTHGGLTIITATVILVVLLALVPLYKPRPRRIIDVVSETQRRILLAALALATIGYFDYTYRLPRMMLVLVTLGLLVLLPAWHVLIRRQKRSATENVIIVGDDIRKITSIYNNLDIGFAGYISLNRYYKNYDDGEDEEVTPESSPVTAFADGGAASAVSRPDIDGLDYLGGLSRLHDILLSYDPDAVVLAFTQTDREEFFGVLNTCYNHGVTTKIHRDLDDNVLTCDTSEYDELVDINLEPWDWQDRMLKRAFDILFAGTGLFVLSPLMVVIAVAIKLDSPGPVFYVQERTSAFGGTFSVFKFRTMIPETEDPTPIDDEKNDRITRVGRILRDTHLDEIPQLWAIFTGKMSIVGPRAAWTDEEKELQKRVGDWQKRWFVKPGLTGLAQIKGASSTNPKQKLGYDVEYIRSQSLPLDIQIIVKQVYKVLKEAVESTS